MNDEYYGTHWHYAPNTEIIHVYYSPSGYTHHLPVASAHVTGQLLPVGDVMLVQKSLLIIHASLKQK
jgi:hypothetical protein